MGVLDYLIADADISRWLFDFMSQGGPVLWAILSLSIILWSLILERLWVMYRTLPVQARKVAQKWQARDDQSSWYARNIRTAWLSQHRQLAEQSLTLIGVLIAICPLLGLLGTVTGMVKVFDVLAITGTGNARAMASGISQATIPTMAGLVIALSGLYFKARFQQLTQNRVQALSEQLCLTTNTKES